MTASTQPSPALTAITTSALTEVLFDQLGRHGAGASIGCLGAIAEFHEPAAQLALTANGLTASSARGALRVRLTGDERLYAYEAPSAHGDGWQCGMALLAPGRRGAARECLTEIGVDHEALDAPARDALLFDLGVGMPNVDYCVRTADPELIAALRMHCGTVVVTPGHPLHAVLVAASPTRVAMSPVARIEVYQAIGYGRTPSGSHTHLLPDLLARRRTHAANLPLPARALPLMTLHPENPLFDAEGQRRAFDQHAFQRFETLLARHGLPEYVAAKAQHRAALATEKTSAAQSRPRTRSARAALRTALRQAPYMHALVDDSRA